MIDGHPFSLHRPGATLRDLGFARAIGELMNHVDCLGTVILKEDPLTWLELTLLHQVLKSLPHIVRSPWSVCSFTK
jgi:hypothetical protein